MKTSQRIQDMIYILTNLTDCNFKLSGIEYKFISSSSHRTMRTVRGIDIKFDDCQLEAITTGRPMDLDVFAYYNKQCFLLKYE